MKQLLATLMLLATFAFAGIRIDVQNGRHQRFQEVIDVKMTAEQYETARFQTLYELEQSGLRTAVPYNWSVEEWDGEDKEYYLSILLTGITSPLSVRTFEFGKGENCAVPSDLSLNGDSELSRVYKVSNQYFSVEHPYEGKGGLFRNINFKFSGTDDKSLTLLDRCFRNGVGIFSMENDKTASAKVVVYNRLRLVIEAKTGYFEGSKPAPGNVRAVYHYTYNAFSPVVKVRARVMKDDNAEWRELHFLHLTSRQRSYDRFVMGDKGDVKIHEFRPKGAESVGAISANEWCVMENDRNAVGVAGPTICWDASKEYFDFIRSATVQSFISKHRRVDLSSSMYFGPASKERDVYAKWLAPEAQLKATVNSDVPSANGRGEFSGEHLLENGYLRLAFSSAADGFACVGIENASHSGPVFCCASGETTPLWRLNFRKGTAEKTNVAISSKDVPADKASVQKEGDTLVFSWKGVALGDGGTFDAVAKVALRDEKSEWTFSVDNHSKEYGLWDSTFPIIGNVFESGTADVLVPHGNWGGSLYHNYKGSYSGSYPSAGAPLQMMAVMRDGHGLYYGIHDGSARAKILAMSSRYDLSNRVCAEDMGVAGSGRKDDFPVVVQLFEGDWWKAAKLYRSWAVNQHWTSRGLIKNDSEYPKRLVDLGFWYLLFSRVENQVEGIVGDTMDRAFKKATVPTGVHWYNWHQIPFDNSYPEYFPIKKGVKEATERMTARGQVVMPYINGRLWDTGIDSFKSAFPYSCKMVDGANYIEEYGSKRKLAPMCPYTKFWQDKINEVGNRLMDEVGFNGIYLDQIGAGWMQLCFDATHGHPIGGGRHWVDGYREMLSRLRASAVKKGVFLATENTAEPYMDNIQAYLVWNPRKDTDVPLLPAVYSGYTTYFSSPQGENDTLQAFRAAQGRDFMWGCQIGWHYFDIMTDAHKEKFDFSMRLAELRLATKDFMVFGELVGEIKPQNRVPLMVMTWNREKPHEACLPCVQGYEWTDGGGRRCIYIINYSDAVRRFEFRLPGSGDDVVLRRVNGNGSVPMAISRGGDDCNVLLEPGEIIAFTVENLSKKGRAALEKEALNYLKKGGDRWLEKAANSFLFQQAGVEFKLRGGGDGSNVVSVDGGLTEIHCTFTNLSGKERRCRIEWPDGEVENVVLPKKYNNVTGISRMCQPMGGFARNSVKAWVEGFDGHEEISFNHIVRAAIHVEVDCPKSVFAGEDFLVTVVSKNHTRRTTDAKILLMVPDGWKVEPSKEISLRGLEAGESRMTILKCRAPVSSRPA